MDAFTILGVIGAALILLAFILNQTHVWKDDYLSYDAVNFAGSALLVIYAVVGRAYPFVVLNAVWAFMSLRDIVLDMRERRGFFRKWLK